MTPITRTDVRVEWTPLARSAFNGDAATGGYIVEYREITDFPSPSVVRGGSGSGYPRVHLKGGRKSKHVLRDLAIGKNYEILVIPYNAQGTGQASAPVSVYVGEAVPTGAPRKVSPNTVEFFFAPVDQNSGNFFFAKLKGHFGKTQTKFIAKARQKK